MKNAAIRQQRKIETIIKIRFLIIYKITFHLLSYAFLWITAKLSTRVLLVNINQEEQLTITSGTSLGRGAKSPDFSKSICFVNG